MAFTLLCFVVFASFFAHNVRAVGAVTAADEHIITLHDDGTDKGFITKATTLRAALQEANIRLDTSDRTEPALDETLVASSYEVNIYRARPVIVRDGNSETKIITAFRTPKQIAEQAGLKLHDEDEAALSHSEDMLADGAAEILTIKYATQFTFVFYGKSLQAYTQAKTVGEMLSLKGVKVATNDTLTPSASTPIVAGMTVQLWKNGEQTVTIDEDVVFATKQIKDANRDIGFKEVKTPGVNGRKTVNYKIIMQNGIEASRTSINETVTKQPVEQVEIIGSKVTNTFSGDFAGALARLRSCEGSYTSNTGNSYYGAYQYDIQTWGGYMGYPNAAAAPPEIQDQKAWETYQRRGWQPWPSCRIKMGLQDIYR